MNIGNVIIPPNAKMQEGYYYLRKDHIFIRLGKNQAVSADIENHIICNKGNPSYINLDLSNFRPILKENFNRAINSILNYLWLSE